MSSHEPNSQTLLPTYSGADISYATIVLQPGMTGIALEQALLAAKLSCDKENEPAFCATKIKILNEKIKAITEK